MPAVNLRWAGSGATHFLVPLAVIPLITCLLENGALFLKSIDRQ